MGEVTPVDSFLSNSILQDFLALFHHKIPFKGTFERASNNRINAILSLKSAQKIRQRF
jgi:hypothetical protein